MGKKWFYGKCKVRPNVKLDLHSGETTIVFSTQQRPTGTKVEDPEPGTHGNNSAEHDPPTHVTLYLCPGGTGGGKGDPLTTWDLIETANALADGRLQVVSNGYIMREWSVRKTDSDGGESVERRFAVEIRSKFDKPLAEQGLGLVARHSAAMNLAVLETQPEFDDMPEPNPKPKRKVKNDGDAAQQGLTLDSQPTPEVSSHPTAVEATAVLSLGPDGMAIEFPEQQPQEPGEVPPAWDFSTFSTAKLLRVLEGGAGTPDYLQAVQDELNSRPVEQPDAAQDLLDAVADLPPAAAVLPEQAESMIEKASSARRGKGPFKLLPLDEQEEGVEIAVWFERSIRASAHDRVPLATLLKELCAQWPVHRHNKDSLAQVINERPDLLGTNPNGTVYSVVEIAGK